MSEEDFVFDMSGVIEDERHIELFKLYTQEMIETYVRKNHDYGNSYERGFKKFGPVQLLSRIDEKNDRLFQLLYNKKRSQVTDEKISDTLTDMAIQCLVLRGFMEQKNQQEQCGSEINL